MKTLRRIIDALRSALMKRAGLLRVLALVGAALAMTAATPSPAEACGITDPLSCIALIFIKIFQLLTALMGWIIALEVEALIRVAQYHNFVSPGPSAVVIGWVVTRDLANMFFIVVLLIIAFGTILGSSTYHYEKNLPRLLIMAVVINFSKTICGLFIDMGQVVMLTFVNGFKEAAAGNFVAGFQINKLLLLAEGQDSYDFGLVVAMMFAFILSAIAACVVLVLLVIMIFRIVMLWILIILSPIAFLTSAIPKGGDYYAQWWKEFKKYIVTGPIIAFFLWLSLASIQDSSVGGGSFATQKDPSGNTYFPSTSAGSGESAGAARVGGNNIPTEAGRADTILSMIIAICLMFAGLKFASESGVMGAGVAKSVRAGAEKYARSIARGGVGVAMAPVGAVVNRAKQGAWGVAGTLATRTPLLNRLTGGMGSAALAKEAEYKKQRKATLERFTGTEAQKAQYMRGGSYAKRVAGMKDPAKKIEAYKLAMANPEAREALYAKDENGQSMANDALMSVTRDGTDAQFADMHKLMMGDKNAVAGLKTDPQALSAFRARAQEVASKDENQRGLVTAIDQKFVGQLASVPQHDRNGLILYEKDDKGELVRDANGQPIGKPQYTAEDLKKMVPKMSIDDIGGLDARGLELLVPHMSDAQLAKARESSVGDKGKSDAVVSGTKKALDDAMSGGDASVIAEAAKRAIHAGALSGEDLKSNDALRGIVGNRMDVGSLVGNMDRSSEGQRAAVSEVMRSVMETNPDRARKMRNQDRYQEFMPSASEFQALESSERAEKETERNVKRDSYVIEVESGGLAKALAAQVMQLRGLGTDTASQQADRLNAAFERVTKSAQELADAQKSLKEAEGRIAGASGMTGPQLEALNAVAQGLRKSVDDLKTKVAKSAAEVKGEKYDDGTGNRSRNKQA
ncbi:MAG TPA: hypothetical protein VJ694_04420 [Patescibacteria group bacterium]|nr:hypothetical protein [Patescibacteria group bacterium]